MENGRSHCSGTRQNESAARLRAPKPDRGAVTSFIEVINQAGEVVMTFNYYFRIQASSRISATHVISLAGRLLD
jgi:hypothetical protein